MKARIVILALLAAIAVIPACKKRPGESPDVTVQFTVGDVSIVSAQGKKPAAVGDPVLYDESIVTGNSSFAELNFGTRGVIRVAENSSVTMAALKGSSGPEQVRFDMEKGKIYVIMSKLTKEEDFSIMTPTTLAAIRGTSFMVVSDPASSKIYVLKGKVLVRLAKDGKLAENIEKLLEANRKVVVSEDLVGEIIAGKKEIEAAPLTPKEVAEIREEMKDIRTGERLDPEAQRELNEIISAEVKQEKIQTGKQEKQKKEFQPIPNF